MNPGGVNGSNCPEKSRPPALAGRRAGDHQTFDALCSSIMTSVCLTGLILSGRQAAEPVRAVGGSLAAFNASDPPAINHPPVGQALLEHNMSGVGLGFLPANLTVPAGDL